MLSCEVPYETLRIPASRKRGIRGTANEHFYSLLRSLPWPGAQSGRPIKSLGMTSCLHGEGVTTVATQTALAAASTGDHRVLVVDAHLARPAAHRGLDILPARGVAECLIGQVDPETVVQATRYSNLWAIPAGHVGDDAARAYGSLSRLRNLVNTLAPQFDLVIWDLPPIGQSDATLQLVGLLDGVVLVMEAERVRLEVAQRVIQRLDRAGTQLLGVALNKRKNHIPDWLYRVL